MHCLVYENFVKLFKIKRLSEPLGINLQDDQRGKVIMIELYFANAELNLYIA